MNDKNEIPQTNIICPVCHGAGKLMEDSQVYEFITRDPQTNTCLVCGGRGHVYPTKKLPNGHSVSTLATRQKKLNVSRKAAGTVEAQEEEERYEKPMFLEMAINHRLNKVLASGKEFLIVTVTEPYYLDVYRLIRNQEKVQGTWTAEDEEAYVEALEHAISAYKEIMRQDAVSANKRQDAASTDKVTTKEVMNG